LPWVWNAVLIFLAIFLGGYMWGTIWTCLVFLESGFAVFLFRTGHNFTNLVPTEVSEVYSLGFYLISLLAIFLFAFLFENERDDARRRQQGKSRMLRDSKRYIEDILNKLPIPTFVLDKNHNVVQWNRACQEMTGIVPYEILGKKVWKGFSMDEGGSLADKLLDSSDVFSEKYSESILSKSDTGSFAVETSLPHLKPGFRAIINTSPIVDQDGMIKGAIQTIQDISARNQGSGTGLGFMGDSIKDSAYPVFKIDSKGKISGWNRACKESFGYSSSQMLGQSPLSLVSKPYRRDFKDTIVQGFKGESFKGKEWKYYTSEGEPVYVLVKVYPVRALSGRVQECVVISADITDLKLRMEKVDGYAAETKDKLKKLGQEYTLLKRNVGSFIRKKNE
jgi:PAS domain S-box-containing protein